MRHWSEDYNKDWAGSQIDMFPVEPEPVLDRIEVYTDGASWADGRGGWAWWTVEVQEFGGEYNTTNQRMELTAALKAMQHFCDQPIEIISDSAYLVNCFNDRWYEKWLTTNYKNGKIKNIDIWEAMLDTYLKQPDLYTFKHVKGHSGVFGNEMADKLAVDAKKMLILK